MGLLGRLLWGVVGGHVRYYGSFIYVVITDGGSSVARVEGVVHVGVVDDAHAGLVVFVVVGRCVSDVDWRRVRQRIVVIVDAGDAVHPENADAAIAIGVAAVEELETKKEEKTPVRSVDFSILLPLGHKRLSFQPLNTYILF